MLAAPTVPQKQAQNQGKNKQNTKGKDKKDEIPIIPQKELYQRLNFSYQASIFLQSLGESSTSSNSNTIVQTLVDPVQELQPGSSAGVGTAVDVLVKQDKKGKRRAVEYSEDVKGDSRKSNGDTDDESRRRLRRLARISMRETKAMSVHTQLKLDPSLKRSICQTCSTILIPGLTSRIRNRPNQKSFSITHHTCLTCQTSLSTPAPPIPPMTPVETITSQELSASTSSAMNQGEEQEQLDGPVRKRRRTKASKRGKRVFHELEKSATDQSGKGHVLWKGDQKVGGWGLSAHVVEKVGLEEKGQ